MLIVEKADPAAPGSCALLAQSHALMQSLFPAEDNHFLSVDALKAPDITFFIARDGSATLGTAALKDAGLYGEIKSMFVADTARGRGVGAALMRALEDAARALCLPAMKLETGNTLHDAHRLYARHGFTPCGPFGAYPAGPTNLFMEKRLD